MNKFQKTLTKQNLEWLPEVPAMKELSNNGYYGWEKGKVVQLHVFAGASDMELCVVPYLRFEKDDNVNDSFVMGNTRVAPIKTTNNPELELQASGINLSSLEEHEITIGRVYRWSDSTTVIQRLDALDIKQQIFVANRIKEILENTKVGEWNHILDAQNPAHLDTRGMRVNEIVTSVWLNGPAWLRENKAQWPKSSTQRTVIEDTLEITQVVTLMLNKPLEIQWELFSSWIKTVHTVCYIIRWKSLNQLKGPISLDEYQKAERMMFKLVQTEAFPTEYVVFTEKKELSSKSSIAQLCQFIDKNGIMRARGRLSKLDFESDTNHPILLPSKHPTMQLMMLKCHLDNDHQGVESMRHELQQKFWILSLRNALRSNKGRCVPYKKYSANVQAPLMANLPRERVEKVDFSFTYVDYFGPLEVKYMRKTMKRWAIHLEMVYSPKRNTGPAMNRPENQCTKRTSKWVTLKSLNSDTNERMNLKLAGSLISYQTEDKIGIRKDCFSKIPFLGSFLDFCALYHF